MTDGVGDGSPQVKASNSWLSRSEGCQASSSSRAGVVSAGTVGRGLGTGVGSCGNGRRLVVGDSDGAAEVLSLGSADGLSDGSGTGSWAGAAATLYTLRK